MPLPRMFCRLRALGYYRRTLLVRHLYLLTIEPRMSIPVVCFDLVSRVAQDLGEKRHRQKTWLELLHLRECSIVRNEDSEL